MFDDPGQAFGDDAKHLVAQAVAVKVIDRFELIEIDDEHGATLVASCFSHLPVELLQESPAIGKPGQRVVPRKPLRILFGRTPLLHLVPEVDDAAHREDDGGSAKDEEERDKLVELIVFVRAAVLKEEIEGVEPN